MKSRKTFIGPRLRQLRRERGETQAQMAKALDLSPAYINLLENNQRSVSVEVLLRLSERYGVDWRDLLNEDAPSLLAELRHALQDPFFGEDRPDIQELRAALDHCPKLVQSFLALHKSYGALTERLLALGDGAAPLLTASPETVVHDLFRKHRNYFDPLERAAETFRGDDTVEKEAFYGFLKERLRRRMGIEVANLPAREMPSTLRFYDEEAGRIQLSDGLDYQNKVFQLTHVAGLVEFSETFDAVIEGSGVSGAREQSRCRVELANYFAAAVLMPYDAFLSEARASRYDLDHLAARFGVSFEQACHRVTTLQREGAQGAPFFFLRIDKAGNVSKRFNATDFPLAEHGGACPRWDIHLSFRTPGRIMTQFVETPDGARYLTVSRTVDRPQLSRMTLDNRLAVTLGCPMSFAEEIVYASKYRLDDPELVTPIGINCRLCPRQHCAQRAHQPAHLELPIDERRRGETRFES